MTPPDVKSLARQGDVSAITELLNRSLNAQNITAAVRMYSGYLEILLEAAAHVPLQSTMVERIRRGLVALEVPVQRAWLHGKQTGSAFPDWSEEVTIATAIPLDPVDPSPTSSTEPPLAPVDVAPRSLLALDPSARDLPGALAVVRPHRTATSKPSTPHRPVTQQRSSNTPSAHRRRSPASGIQASGIQASGIQLRVGSVVLVDIPAKHQRTAIITAIVLALQIGAIGLGLALWGRSTQQPIAQRSTTSGEPRLSTSPSSANKVYRAAIKYRHHGIPVIDVTFNYGQTFEMIVDTGASGTLITQEMASSLQVTPMGWIDIGVADGRVVTLPTGTITAISVDGATITNVPVVIAQSMPIGLLGHDFFDGFDIKIKEDIVEFYPRQSK